MIEKEPWYSVWNADEIDSPALLFYPARMRENIELLKTMIKEPLRLRPHIKTHKTKEAALMMMESGIQKFKCASISEAELLGMVNAPDVLLAYQPTGPKLKRLISLQHHYQGTVYSCLVDNLSSAAAISSAAVKEKLVVPIYIDLNVGMNRTGVVPGEKAIEIYRFCSSLKGLRPIGLHFYDGQIREKDIKKRWHACSELLLGVKKIKMKLMEEGFEKPQLVGGGSASFPVYAQEEEIECSPGTFIFWDKGYQDTLPEQGFLPAAVLITRIISLPDPGKICMDLGYKSISSENELTNRVHFLNAPELKVINQSEEHLVAEAPLGHSWKLGDLIYVLPVHICPTVALFDRAFVVNDGFVSDTWKIIARDRIITY